MSIFKRGKKQHTGSPSRGRTEDLCTVIVAAAGQGERMGGEGKMLLQLGGRPVIARTVEVLEACPDIDEIVISAREQDVDAITGLCAAAGYRKLRLVIRGGATRAESIMLALLELGPHTQLVAIHDGARPLVSSRLCSAVIEAARQTGAAAPGLTPKETIKRLGPDGKIVGTIDRSTLVAVQTPQCFNAALYKAALAKVMSERLPCTDDCFAMEQMGMKIALVPGEETNLKLTTPDDLRLAEALLALEARP